MSGDIDASGPVVPDIPFVRQGEEARRATFFELFFDLVYVLAITQLSHHLVAHLGWTGAAQTLFLLLTVYWAWNYTTWMANWFDPAVPAVALVLMFVMLASLLMAVSIPEAFGDYALVFAGSYCALQIVRNSFVVAVTPAGRFNRNYRQILVWSLLSTPLWVGGALTGGSGRWWWWLAALGLDLVAPLARYWLPGVGRTPLVDWQIDPHLFAERFHLLVIIVLGESIVATGATASEAGLQLSSAVALAFGFVSSVALWWLYFGPLATQAARRLAADDVPGQAARDAYTYLHLLIIAGILLTAVADELVIAHPGDELGTAGALTALAGPALYLLGLAAFGARVGRHQPWTRTTAAGLLVAGVPLAVQAPALAVAGAAAALLSLVVVADWMGVGHARAPLADDLDDTLADVV